MIVPTDAYVEERVIVCVCLFICVNIHTHTYLRAYTNTYIDSHVFGFTKMAGFIPTTQASKILVLTLLFVCSHNPKLSTENLAEFSHVWLIYIFHENTNIGRQVCMHAMSSQMSNFVAC